MGRLLACSDLHGQYELWEQIKKYCEDDDTIYFLGDAIDRGKDGLKIMREMLNDSRVIYMLGNHEDLMLKSLLDYFSLERNDMAGYYWRLNGGKSTIKDVMALPRKEQDKLMKAIMDMPDYLELTNKYDQKVILCHAGTHFTEDLIYLFFMDGDNPFIWDRNHFSHSLSESEKTKDSIMVHGHTPVCSLHYVSDFKPDNELEPFIYDSGHKIDIDLGSAMTGAAALFDLDELKTLKVFKTEIEDEDD